MEDARGVQHDAAKRIDGLCLDNLVPCRALRLFWLDGGSSTGGEAVLNGNTIFPDRHFRAARWTILPSIHSISPQRINRHDQICDRATILAHSRSTRRHGRCRRRDSYALAEPAGIETPPSSLRSASNVHQRDQRSGYHKQARKIDRTALRNAVARLSPG